MQSETVKLSTVPKVQTWKQVEADLAEVKADTLDAVIHAIEQVDGMFTDRSEIKDALEVARNLCAVESQNLRKQAA